MKRRMAIWAMQYLDGAWHEQSIIYKIK